MSTKTDLVAIYESKPWEVRQKLKEYIASLDDEEEKKPGTRSLSQNKALHLLFEWVATSLNDAGLDMRAVLKPEVDIPWSKETVKEHMWKPIMRLQTGKESTTQLDKAEIDQVFDTFVRHLGKHGVELEFPSADKRSEFFEAMDMRERLEYPTHGG